MAISKAFVVSLLLTFLMFLHVTQARLHVESDHIVSSNSVSNSLLNSIDCGASCQTRCRLSSRPNLCHRACGTCCARCGCVPPGTAGNKDVCPCYANMTTRGGKPKCP